MEDEDDDFGDLYADVEVGAVSAINVAPQLPNSQFVNTETVKQNDDNIDIASGDADNGNNDDDDDDLDIVLNSDDDSVRHSDKVTVVRNNANLGSREIDDADDDNLRTEEFTGGIAVGNSHSMYKYLRPQPAAYGSGLKVSRCVTTSYLSQEDNGYSQRMGSRSMGPQSIHRFSLPWSRNILDVNIDIFEQKPWKDPGVDITDYFNFGFDEDSWKLYCNQVDEYRHRGLMYSWTLASEPAQLTDLDWRKGRAIEVEESIVERQSTLDVRGHMDRDSDAIHICILDPGEHLDSYVPETSNQRDVSGDDDDDMGHLSFSIASEDESVVGSHLELEIQAPKRSSNQKISSKLVRRSSENHEIYQVSEGSGGTVQAIRFSNNSKDTCTADPSMLVAESSEPEKSSASYLVDSKRSDYKTEHGRNNYHAKHSSPVYNSRNHGETKHRHHDVNDDSYSRRVGDKREHVDHKYHSRCNSHVYNNRPRREFNPKSLHEKDIYSRRTYDQRKTGEHRYHPRNSNPVYNLETYHENDDYFSMSHIEGTYAVESNIDHERWIERLQSFDPYNEEKVYLKSELPSDYYGERFSSYEHWDTERYGTEMDQSVFRSSEEEYCDEQRRYIDDNRMMEGRWCLNGRGSQWQRRENLYFRNKGENDDLYLEREYSDYMLEEQFGSLTYNGRERDEVECGYGKNVAHTRWDFRGAVRKKMRVSSPFSELNNSLLKSDEYIASQSSEESHLNNGRWHGNMTPRDSLSRRHGRFRAQYSKPVDTGDYMINIDGHVNMERTRHRWQYEMQSEEDEILFRHEDAKFYAERTLLPFEKVSRHKMFVSDHVESVDDTCEWLFMGGAVSPNLHLVSGCDHVEPLTDGPRVKRAIYRQKKEVFSGNEFAKPHGGSCERLSLSCRNSLDPHLVVREGKSSAKHIKPKWMDFNSCINDKVVRTVISKAKDKGLDIKEGQILTEEVNIGPIKDDTMAHVNDVKKGLDNTRILEAMAKMEKRRARFNEPVTASRKDSDTAADTVHETALNKQHRPARKRRWGGS